MTQNKESLTQLLIASLRQEEFVLYRQLIRPAAGRKMQRGFQEVLVRFQQEEDKLLPPGTFFPILEDGGLLPMLDRWVVSKVGRWIHSTLSARPDWTPPCTNINLSSQTLADAAFGAFVHKQVELSKVPKHALGFEISMDSVERLGEEVARIISMLRPVGCSFTLSSFEGDEKSLTVLKYLKPDFIKPHTRLTRNVRAGAPQAQALSLLQSVCRSLNVATIAEQIEDAHVIGELERIGIDYLQGFGISTPAPLSA